MVALLMLDGRMNGAAFRAYVEQTLAAILRTGHIVTVDNFSVHKLDGVRQAIEARGAELVYQPPYFLALNPIERQFARLKALRCKPPARTVSALWAAIGAPLENLELDDCANYNRYADEALTTADHEERCQR